SRLRGLATLPFEQSLRPREPSGRGSALTTQEKTEADPERAADGAGAVARIPVRTVRAFQGALELLHLSDQERRGRQPLEVYRTQGGLAISHGEELVGLLPGPALVGPPAALQVLARHVISMNCHAPKSRRSGQRVLPP